jgi:hypothetical protein
MWCNTVESKVICKIFEQTVDLGLVFLMYRYTSILQLCGVFLEVCNVNLYIV